MRRKQSTLWGLLVMVAVLGCALPGSAWSRSAAAPVITGFGPHQGIVGERVTIYGHDLTGAQVQFNGMAATDVTVDAAGTHITLNVPPESTTGPIVVTTPGGTATSTTAFRVNPASRPVAVAKPEIMKVMPARGHAGMSVTITGKNLAGAMAVKFAGVKAIFTVSAANRIVAKVPKVAHSGAISVVTAGGVGVTAAHFVVTSG